MSILPRIEMLLATNAASAKTGWVGVVAAPEPTVGDFFVYEALEVSFSCILNACSSEQAMLSFFRQAHSKCGDVF
jgi:hypothetical protein